MSLSYKNKYYLRQLVKLTPLYRKAYKSISFDQSDTRHQEKLKEIIQYAIDNCLYYKDYKPIGADFNIEDYPIIHKPDLLEHGDSMVSQKFRKRQLFSVATGGTTGPSVNVIKSYREEIVTTVYFDSIINQYGKDGVLCSIREHDLKPDEKYRFFGNRLMLSPNSINEDSAAYYFSLMKQHKVSLLHVYPSSILAFCKYLQHQKIDTSDLPLKAIIASSEIFAPETKQLVKKVFPQATIIDFYGQTENVAAGVAMDFGPMRFFTSYGYVELVDIDVSERGNRIAEIVATSLIKKSQPLIRYATGDFVEIEPEGQIKTVIGRTSDFLIGKDGNLIPAIITNSPHSHDNVILKQYFQDTPGKFDYNIVVNDKFIEADKKMIEADIYENFGEALIGTVKIVDHIEQTKRGKHKKLIQKLDVQSYIDAM